MVRPLPHHQWVGQGSPHPRGDGPEATGIRSGPKRFSPPAWGWSAPLRRPHIHPRVLPTRVGMVRLQTAARPGLRRSPHPRGDGPVNRKKPEYRPGFSPPAWGWSGSLLSLPFTTFVLPTRVGMVRRWRRRSQLFSCSPHPRGDGPGSFQWRSGLRQFSPPAWGWSDAARARRRPNGVLPTRVGMVRSQRDAAPGPRGSPHPRGDGPARKGRKMSPAPFSPPAWGWSVFPASHARLRQVLPTRVGMVLVGNG